MDLQTESSDHSKLVNILFMAALAPKQPDLKNVALVVAFLLDTNITDYVLSFLADAVANKSINHLEGLFKKLDSMADFLAANDVSRAEATLNLKAIAKALSATTNKLEALSPVCPTKEILAFWALIAHSAANFPLSQLGSQQVATSRMMNF